MNFGFAIGYCLGVLLINFIVVGIVNAINKNKDIERHEGIFFFSTKYNCIACLITNIIDGLFAFFQFFNNGIDFLTMAAVFFLIGALITLSIVKYKSFN